jgi:hypothetical protein
MVPRAISWNRGYTHYQIGEKNNKQTTLEKGDPGHARKPASASGPVERKRNCDLFG